MKKIGSEISGGANFSKRSEFQKGLLSDLKKIYDKTFLGGGEKLIAKQHAKNKLTARERIDLLIDDNTEFFELNTLAAHGMYGEFGGAPSSGTVIGIGAVKSVDCMIVANDATVKAGA